MKPEQLCGQRGIVATVSPGVQVPYKVVQQRDLSGRGGRIKIVARCAMVESREYGKLQNHAKRTHQIELHQRTNVFTGAVPAGRAVRCAGQW